MDILNLMSKAHEGQTVVRLGTHFELSENEVGSILGYVVPYLEDALTRLMATPQGLAAILAQLASGQYQRDLSANNIFESSRILANGTGALSLLLRNEATIRVISYVAAEGSHIDAAIIRRMMPYIATIYISALAKRSNEPLQQLAERFNNISPFSGHGTYGLAEFVLSNTSAKEAEPNAEYNRGSIKDILNTLSKVEMDEEVDNYFMK
jgi:hypothetical protein